jgi:alpha-galactosidase
VPAVKIVLIGASRVFAPSIVADLWDARDDLAGSTLALCDLNADGLRVVTDVIQRMIDERGMPYRLESSTDRRDLLDGADFVVTSIAVDHRRLWEIDIDVARRHGLILTTGDTVGTGGWSRALRTVPVFQAIAADMEDLCPDAWLFNYTNPMSVICRTLEKTTELKVVGLCHGIEGTTQRIAEFMRVEVDSLSVRAAGINHLQWIMDLTREGQDFYPEFKAAPHPPPDSHWEVSWELMDIYGMFPSPGDRHVSEFCP